MQAIAIQSLVRRLLLYEAGNRQDQASLIEASERVSAKLRTHLSKRIGKEGFRTLLGRALALTIVQFPHMSTVRVAADGSPVGLRKAAGSSSQEAGDTSAPDTNLEGAVAFVVHLLELLVTFIGEDLTLRILSAVWPDFALEDATVLENERP